jgi:hypothetical protein
MDNQKQINYALMSGQLIAFINSMKYWMYDLHEMGIDDAETLEAFIESEIRKIKNNSQV